MRLMELWSFHVLFRLCFPHSTKVELMCFEGQIGMSGSNWVTSGHHGHHGTGILCKTIMSFKSPHIFLQILRLRICNGVYMV